MILGDIAAAMADKDGTAKRFFCGAMRVCAPVATLARIMPLCGAAGITRVANITNLDRLGLPVVAAIRPNSRSLSVSQGKGATLEAAKVSAVMEALELYHAERIHLPLIYGSVRELSRFELVDTERLPSVQRSRFHHDLPILWIEGHDLVTGSGRWVPFEMVHASARVPAPAGSGCFSATSNGLASGNHLVEAMLHAVCEVIERDSTTMWEASLDRRPDTRLDLTSIDDDVCRRLLTRLAEANVAVAVWSTTTDCGVPAFICEIVDAGANGELPLSSFTGMGCHPSRSVALSRAITEAVQCRLTYIAGSRDDLFRREYSPTFTANQRPRYADLRLAEPTITFADIVEFSAPTIREDLDWVLERLGAMGCEQVIVVELSKPEYGVPVVRVIIPGLEGPDDDPSYVAGPRALRAKERT